MLYLKLTAALLGILVLFASCLWSTEQVRLANLVREKDQVCKEFIEESCVAMVGCGYTTSRERCLMAIRSTSICEDPQSIDLEKYKAKLQDIKQATCEDISLAPAPTEPITPHSEKGDAGLDI